jgi:hypothetical protein
MKIFSCFRWRLSRKIAPQHLTKGKARKMARFLKDTEFNCQCKCLHMKQSRTSLFTNVLLEVARKLRAVRNAEFCANQFISYENTHRQKIREHLLMKSRLLLKVHAYDDKHECAITDIHHRNERKEHRSFKGR